MRRFAAIATTVVLALSALALGPIAATAADPVGSVVSGTVTGAGGLPVRGVLVDFRIGNETHTTVTTTDGTYAITLLEGTYSTLFTAPGNYFPQSFGGGTPLTVVEGVDHPLDMALQSGGVISGTVTNSGGDTLNNIQIVLYSSARADPLKSVQTANGGTYRFEGLVGGDYYVQAADALNGRNLISIWYPSAYSRSTASTITVDPGDVISANLTLPSGATVTGTLTDSIGSAVPLAVVGTGTSGSPLQSSAASGTFSFEGVIPQDYSFTTAPDPRDFFAPTAPVTVTASDTPATVDLIAYPQIVPIAEVTVPAAVTGPVIVEASKTYTWQVSLGGNANVYAILYSASPQYLGAATRPLGGGTVAITLTIPAGFATGTQRLTFSSLLVSAEVEGTFRSYLDLTVQAPPPVVVPPVVVPPVVVPPVVVPPVVVSPPADPTPPTTPTKVIPNTGTDPRAGGTLALVALTLGLLGLGIARRRAHAQR